MADNQTTSSQPIQTDINENLVEPDENSDPHKETIELHKIFQNKLKRRNKLPMNMPNDANDDVAINMKKRSKIEIIQNKENLTEVINKVITKPPLPPKNCKTLPPPRLKRKLEENISMIQKLNAQNEQLRIEITDLKVTLGNEKNSIRALRAQNESTNRKSKSEIKKLQLALEASKKLTMAPKVNLKRPHNVKEETNNVKDIPKLNTNNSQLLKITKEVIAWKDENKLLEEKIQMSNEKERKKNVYVQEVIEKYETKLTQISKSAKIEINRLLEEIKAKERNIGLLKKEINSLKNNLSNSKKDIKISQHSTEMKKLKDIVETSNDSMHEMTNKKCNISNSTTCGQKVFNKIPHELKDRILEVHDLHIYRVNDHVSSDSDSALSSAPQSISPQPPTSDGPTDIWQTVKNYTKELESVQHENTSLQNENENLKKELQLAKNQINDFEKTVLEANKSNRKLQQLTDRMKYLEQKEVSLMKETHELREQNELLEFRILELEESHDKWSLRSNSTPDTKDMWTDTEKEHDDMLIFTDHRSDSGITSPQSHNNIDDRNLISPCDLSIPDSMSNDEIKKRITLLCKKSHIEDEEKICLIHVINLINNLDAISNDSIGSDEDLLSLELVKSKISDCNSLSSRSLLLPSTLTDKAKTNNNRIVATVLPYSSTLSTPTDSPSRKLRSWASSSLQESGVFEGDSIEQFYTQSTQTDPEDLLHFNNGNPITKDLCAEIQKLNKFREQIEECVTKTTNKKVVPLLSPNLSDQKRLQYYKERLELLEKKIIVYESSGDVQAKHLAERLQREVQLEGLVKDLQEKAETLESENLQLEEEKCEFEEAENDTRLRLQRLEVDLEILSQRNVELEMSREQLQNKLKDSRTKFNEIQNQIEEARERIHEVEEEDKELKNRLNLIKLSMPAVLLYNAFMVEAGFRNFNDIEIKETTVPMLSDRQPDLNKMMQFKTKNNDNSISSITEFENAPSEPFCKYNSLNSSMQIESLLQPKLTKLMSREKDLVNQISELNRAYQETMENADTLWAQIEKEYKDKLNLAEHNEYSMKLKITQLEQRLSNDSQVALERISQLEESESDLKHRFSKLSKDQRDLLQEHNAVIEEYHHIKEELNNLRKFVDGPSKESLDLEKCRVKNLQEELIIVNKILNDLEQIHRQEIQSMQNELFKVRNEVLQIEVTNGELKEEVCTLEKEIMDLGAQRKYDDDKIRCLSDELRAKDETIVIFEKKLTSLENFSRRSRRSFAMNVNKCYSCGCDLDGASGSPPSLAQELTCGSSKRIKMDEVRDLRTASSKLGEALNYLQICGKCKPDNDQIQEMARDVKSFADIMLNDEQQKNEQKYSLTDEHEKKMYPNNMKEIKILRSRYETDDASSKFNANLSLDNILSSFSDEEVFLSETFHTPLLRKKGSSLISIEKSDLNSVRTHKTTSKVVNLVSSSQNMLNINNEASGTSNIINQKNEKKTKRNKGGSESGADKPRLNDDDEGTNSNSKKEQSSQNDQSKNKMDSNISIACDCNPCPDPCFKHCDPPQKSFTNSENVIEEYEMAECVIINNKSQQKLNEMDENRKIHTNKSQTEHGNKSEQNEADDEMLPPPPPNLTSFLPNCSIPTKLPQITKLLNDIHFSLGCVLEQLNGLNDLKIGEFNFQNFAQIINEKLTQPLRSLEAIGCINDPGDSEQSKADSTTRMTNISLNPQFQISSEDLSNQKKISSQCSELLSSKTSSTNNQNDKLSTCNRDKNKYGHFIPICPICITNCVCVVPSLMEECGIECYFCHNQEAQKCNTLTSNFEQPSAGSQNCGLTTFIQEMFFNLKDVKTKLNCDKRDETNNKECSGNQDFCYQFASACNDCPATIQTVRPIGKCALLVKWCIHDCSNIGGYEVIVDGYTTNRYYSANYKSAVVYDVDINLKHTLSLCVFPLNFHNDSTIIESPCKLNFFFYDPSV